MKLKRDDLSLARLQTTTEILTQGFRPRVDLAPWPLASPIDWGADPFGESNWRFQLHALRIADPFVIAYFDDARREHADYVLGTLLSWYRYAEEAIADGMVWHDMATGFRAMKVAFLIDVAKMVGFSADIRRQLDLIAEAHIRHLTNPAERSWSNHGLFQICGAELLIRVCPDATWAEEARKAIREHFDALLLKQFTPQGVHREHSPGYHFFFLRNLGKLPSVARLNSASANSVLAKAATVSGWLIRPDNSIVPFGDTANSFRFHATSPSGTAWGDYVVSNFAESGYCVVRSHPSVPIEKSSMLFFTCMRYNRSHKHDDDLAFDLFEFGKSIITDAGKYAYKKDAFRSYAKRQAAHSAAGIVEDDSRNRPTQLYGSGLQDPAFRDGRFYLQGAVSHPTYQHTRKLTYVPGKKLVVKDRLISTSAQHYVSRLLFDANIRVVQHARGLRLEIDGGHTAEIRCSHDPILLQKGAMSPIRGWQTVGYGQMIPTTSAEVFVSGKSATIKWSIKLSASDS